MKNKNRLYLKQMTVLFLVLLMSFSQANVIYAQKTDSEFKVSETESVTDAEQVIEISTVEEFLSFAEACKVDTYSFGKVVELRNDISLKDTDFKGIAYFNGTFHGNGYKITNLLMDETGSRYGLFRYIGESGVVSNLEVKGTIAPNGSKTELGGIAGVNYGVIEQCTFAGTVYGEDRIGAIAGLNCSTGKILNCTALGLILGTDYTGGIAGVNEGVITACENKARINIEELEPELDLGGIDLGTMNFAQTVVTRSYMGGIAGLSSGIIKDCANYGEIGYAHTGYNVGGIAGSQKGTIVNCINEGDVYGRKDVGGIVGQAEPYIESEFLSDQIDLARDDMERISRTMNHLSSDLEKYSNQAKGYSDSLALQLESTTNSLNDRLNQIENAIPENNPSARGYMNNISEAMQEIERIQNEDDTLSQEDLDAIAVQMEIIERNTELLNEVTSGNQYDGILGENGTFGDTGTSNLNGEQLKGDILGLSESVKNSMDALTNGIETLSGQMDTLAQHLYNSTAVLRGEEELIVDVSSIKNASKMDGVISGCINRGLVDGDLNVAGIAGTMNLEYGDDPEANLNLSEDVDVAISSEINDVIIDCANFGQINGKKNYIGAIVGLQELGLVYRCEGYGHIDASAGTYVGGIAGRSNAVIQKCYTMLDVSGKDYVGGIAGNAKEIRDSYSIVKINSTGECIGSIAGYAEKITDLIGNYFVKEQYEGVDDISYTGSAEQMSYDKMLENEDVPEGFYMVQVAFVVEGNVIKETMIGYGSTLRKEDFPELADRENAYVVWPEEEVYTDIRNNVTIEAVYQPWTQSIASSEQTENHKAYFIAVEKFFDGTRLELVPEDDTMELLENQKLLYAFDWNLKTVNEQMIDSVEGHFYLPEVQGETELWLQTIDGWKMATYTVDGSYLVTEIPVGTSFALVENVVDNSNSYLIAGLGIIGFILVFFGIIIHNKRKKKRKGMITEHEDI